MSARWSNCRKWLRSSQQSVERLRYLTVRLDDWSDEMPSYNEELRSLRPRLAACVSANGRPQKSESRVVVELLWLPIAVALAVLVMLAGFAHRAWCHRGR